MGLFGKKQKEPEETVSPPERKEHNSSSVNEEQQSSNAQKPETGNTEIVQDLSGQSGWSSPYGYQIRKLGIMTGISPTLSSIVTPFMKEHGLENVYEQWANNLNTGGMMSLDNARWAASVSRIFYTEAVHLASKKNHLHAVEFFNHALFFSPHNPKVNYFAGRTYESLNLKREAYKSFAFADYFGLDYGFADDAKERREKIRKSFGFVDRTAAHGIDSALGMTWKMSYKNRPEIAAVHEIKGVRS